MNDWLHCNKCSTKFQPPMKLFLSECGHIFCEKCGENIKESKCLICDKTSNFIPISKDMDISVQQFFIPLDLQIKKLSEVYNFQMQHRMRMFQTLAQKYAFAKKECINVHNKNKNLLRENRTLKNMLMSATRNNNLPFLTSTPALTNDTSQMDDMSVVSSIPPFTPSVSSRPGHLQRIQNNDSNIRASHYPPHMYSGNSGASVFHRLSPAQMVPNGARNTRINMAAIHRPLSTTVSLQELRAVGKRT